MKYKKIKFIPRRLHVKTGDTVYITSGKDKTKTGKIIKVFTKKGKVLVEGINIITKHLKPDQENSQGGIVKKPNPVFSSKVMLYCTKCSKPTRIQKKVLADGKKVRVCKHCGEVL